MGAATEAAYQHAHVRKIWPTEEKFNIIVELERLVVWPSI